MFGVTCYEVQLLVQADNKHIFLGSALLVLCAERMSGERVTDNTVSRERVEATSMENDRTIG